MTALAVSDLHKGFGSHHVLRGAALDVAAGSFTAILGPSGSGKTTLLRVLAGFERADAGTIEVDGRVVESAGRHVPPDRRGIGYVPQEGALFPHLDVAANIGFGLPRARRRPRVTELLDLIGLADLSDRYPHELSGGQQQRVALARALAPAPSVILLDEPYSSLDAGLRASVRLDVARILRAAGTTAVLVTHDQDEALSLADRVAVLRDGRFVQCGSPEDIYVRPSDARTAAFVGDANLLAAVPTGLAGATVVTTAIGAVEVSDSPSPGPLTVLVRPEQIELADDGVAATVVTCAYYGHDTVVTVAVTSSSPSAAPVTVRVRLAGASPLAAGATVRLRARGTAAVFPG